MNIVHLLGSRQLPRQPDQEAASGVARVALEIARRQVAQGHTASVISIDQGFWQTTWEGVTLAGIAVASGARIHIRQTTLDFRQHLPYVLLTLRNSYDIIHGHIYSYMRFLRARARIVHFHSDPFYRGRRNEGIDLKESDFKAIAKNSNAQIAVSHFIGQELQRGFGTMGNVHVIHNGVDTERFDPQRCHQAGLALRNEKNIPKYAVVFLFCGAIVKEKGVIHLARAFAQLALERDDVHLIVAGGSNLWGGVLGHKSGLSDYEEEIRLTLHQSLAHNQVYFLGNVPSSHMPAVYAASDVIVIPSIWREPFPLVALEGLAAAKPIIGSSIGGIVETVSNDNGRLVEPENEAELLQAMRTLTESPTLRKQLGSVSQQKAHSFTWEAALQQIDRIYHHALS